MPRIRNLKPQFWDSPDTARADLACRLLYMAMWNWADDAGRGTANLKELEAFAFPNDDIQTLPRRASAGSARNSATVWSSFAELFLETIQVYKVDVYVHGGRKFYEISSFREHQSKHFNPNSTLPGPADGQEWDVASEYGLNTTTGDDTVPEEGPHSARNSAISCRDLPLDRDRDRDTESLTLVGGSGGKGATPARGTRLPDNWQPDRHVIDAMREEAPHIDLRREHRRFTDHWKAATGRTATKRDWNAAWRNWIRTAADRAPATNSHQPPSKLRQAAERAARARTAETNPQQELT